MSSIVSSIVGGVNEQNSIGINVHGDDWATEMSTIASNDSKRRSNQEINSEHDHKQYNKQMLQRAESCCQAILQQWCLVTLSRSLTRHLYK